MHIRLGLSIASIALAACACAAHGQTFADCSQAELVKAAPELSALEFSTDQRALDPLLRTTGQVLESMNAKPMNVSIAEDVHEMRFDRANVAWIEHRDKFRYVVQTHPFTESRRQPQGGNTAIPGHFVEMLSDLLPENRNRLRFRYLGRIAGQGLVMAFIAGDGTRQGLVWVDEATKQVLRIRTDTLRHPEAEKFESFTRDVRFVPLNFSASGTTLTLPWRATVHIRFAEGELHDVHRFSDYQVDGVAARAAEAEDDGFEALLKGVAAMEGEKPGDAVAPFREAMRLLPDRFEPGYFLGLALYRTHDLAGAETQFREGVKQLPNWAAAHNELGAVLFARGDKPGAAAEFQEAARLEPGNAKMRANLEAVTGSGAAIKVDVREVLVPVVVTDKEGKHVTGLTETDFKIFEDGVEQKITAFTSERVDIHPATSPGAASSERDSATPADSAKPSAARSTYVICLDMMHASLGNLPYVRKALQKLFQGEGSGDSQYAVIALGRNMEVVQNYTSDPAKVLEAFSDADFLKIFQLSQKNEFQVERSRYERELQEVRQLCENGDSSCGMRKQSLPHEANELAEEESFSTTQFLTQFRSLVEQIARGHGRRTMILISDGFVLAPGEMPFGLLEAYFPDAPQFRSTRTVERMPGSMDPIYRLAAKGNVPIYTIDSRGLYTTPSLDISRGFAPPDVAPGVDRTVNGFATDEGLMLAEIAETTGGVAFHNSNDLFTGLQRAFADGREYYTLAYVSANAAQDGKFRKIEVKVRDKKARVSAKRGYWAASQ